MRSMLARSAPGREQVEVRQRGLHAAASRREARLAEQRIEPDQAARARPSVAQRFATTARARRCRSRR